MACHYAERVEDSLRAVAYGDLAQAHPGSEPATVAAIAAASGAGASASAAEAPAAEAEPEDESVDTLSMDVPEPQVVEDPARDARI